MLATLQEQARWHRAAVLPGARTTIEQALPKNQLRQAYEMCDGKTANKEIAKVVGKSEATISRWASGWRDAASPTKPTTGLGTL